MGDTLLEDNGIVTNNGEQEGTTTFYTNYWYTETSQSTFWIYNGSLNPDTEVEAFINGQYYDPTFYTLDPNTNSITFNAEIPSENYVLVKVYSEFNTQSYMVQIFDEQGRPTRTRTGGLSTNFGSEIMIGNTRLTDNNGSLDLNGSNIFQYTEGTRDSDLINFGQMKTYIKNNTGGLEMQDSCISIVNDPSTITPSNGARYLVGTSPVGVFSSNANDIAVYNNSSWSFISPTLGFLISIDNVPNSMFLYSGFSWSEKKFESTTASNGIKLVNGDLQANLEANNPTMEVIDGALSLKLNTDKGLGRSADGIAPLIDTNVFEFDSSSGSIKIKSDSITMSYISSSALGNGLNADGESIAIKPGEDIIANVNGTNYDYGIDGYNTTGTNIPKDTVVFYNSIGNIKTASVDGEKNLKHGSLFGKLLGITSANIPNSRTDKVFVREGKIIPINDASFTPALPVFLGVDGTLTQVKPDTSGYEVIVIGFALSSTTIFFNPIYEAKLY